MGLIETDWRPHGVRPRRSPLPLPIRPAKTQQRERCTKFVLLRQIYSGFVFSNFKTSGWKIRANELKLGTESINCTFVPSLQAPKKIPIH